ncbi:hypothetical protein PILCRDRAFT_813581 [Piloderma croceum F 1598]|uniref:RRM domain-containing protein n=1 Tax=Piloderma croceum (strain F 1598) TaxID=765440 RepID=A0A0C3GA77_PILCF|nr:hypothetical protein PILCRDRAFT_813581 [Piloderma croceum F 1598]
MNDRTPIVVAADSLPNSPSFPTISRIDSLRIPRTPPKDINMALLMPGHSGHILRRRRSHLRRWIEDQQYQAHVEPDDFLNENPDDPVERIGTPCNPYLAYPHLSKPSYYPRTLDEVGSMHNYVVVDDVLEDETHVDDDHASVDSDGAEHMSPPASSAIDDSTQDSPSMMRNGPSSFRNFRLPFRPLRAHAISLSGESAASHSSSRLSLFRTPRQSTSTARTIGRHNKSSSLSTLNLTPRGISSDDSVRVSTSVSSSWRWRASVRSHFSSSPAPPKIQVFNSEPRPSMSSTNTYSSALTPPTTYQDEDAEFLSTSPKTLPPNSARSRAKSPVRPLFRNDTGTASVPSLYSGPTSVSHTPETSGSTSALVHKESAIRIPFSPKPIQTQLSPTSSEDDEAQTPVDNLPQLPKIVYPSIGKGSTSRLSLSSLSSLSSPRAEKRKKKLVVSGIGVNDTQKLEAITKWCESFGEVTQILRLPNGDLHVHFRKADVAETVCRVRARVSISGVGSVQLSWFTGEKR